MNELILLPKLDGVQKHEQGEWKEGHPFLNNALICNETIQQTPLACVNPDRFQCRPVPIKKVERLIRDILHSFADRLLECVINTPRVQKAIQQGKESWNRKEENLRALQMNNDQERLSKWHYGTLEEHLQPFKDRVAREIIEEIFQFVISRSRTVDVNGALRFAHNRKIDEGYSSDQELIDPGVACRAVEFALTVDQREVSAMIEFILEIGRAFPRPPERRRKEDDSLSLPEGFVTLMQEISVKFGKRMIECFGS